MTTFYETSTSVTSTRYTLAASSPGSATTVSASYAASTTDVFDFVTASGLPNLSGAWVDPSASAYTCIFDVSATGVDLTYGQPTIWRMTSSLSTDVAYSTGTPSIDSTSGTGVKTVTLNTGTWSLQSGQTYQATDRIGYRIPVMNANMMTSETLTLNVGTTSQTAVMGSPVPPSAPATVTALSSDSCGMINWSTSSGATGYNVYTSAGSLVATITNGSIDGYFVSGLTNGTSASYKVTATNSAGESGFSSTVTINPTTWAITRHGDGSAGTSVTTTNDVGSAGVVQIVGSGSLTYTASGKVGNYIRNVSSTATALIFNDPGPSSSQFGETYSRAYMKAETLPASSTIIGQIARTGAGTSEFGTEGWGQPALTIDSSGNLICNSVTLGTVAAGAWFRVEARVYNITQDLTAVNTGSFTVEWRVFTGSNVDGTTATGSTTVTESGFSPFVGIGFVLGPAVTTSTVFDIDEIELRGASNGWIGPLVPISSSDARTCTESQTVSIVLSASDSATRTESQSIAVTTFLSSSDSGASTDAGSAYVISVASLPPDAILVETNLTGAVGLIQDDPNTPDANYVTNTGKLTAAELRVSFPTPTGDILIDGANLQQFQVYIRPPQ